MPEEEVTFANILGNSWIHFICVKPKNAVPNNMCNKTIRCAVIWRKKCSDSTYWSGRFHCILPTSYIYLYSLMFSMSAVEVTLPSSCFYYRYENIFRYSLFIETFRSEALTGIETKSIHAEQSESISFISTVLSFLLDVTMYMTISLWTLDKLILYIRLCQSFTKKKIGNTQLYRKFPFDSGWPGRTTALQGSSINISTWSC